MGSEMCIRDRLGLNGKDALKVFGVYRDPDVVFDEKSMMSLAGRPVTRGHPKSGVSADSWKELTVGQMGGVIKRDGEHVVAPMAIMDSSAVQEVMSGARGLSAGYTVGITAADGVAADGTPYQFKQSGELRFNHVAYLPDNNPRAGNTRIGDSWATPVIDCEPGKSPTNPTKGVSDMELKPVVLGDKAFQVAATDAAAIEQFRNDMLKKVADAESAKKESDSEKDKEIGRLTAELKTAQDAAESMDVDKLAAERAELIAKVKSLDASIETLGKSGADLRKAAVQSKLGDAAVANRNADQIEGMFEAIAASAPANPVAVAIKSGVKTVGDSATALNDAQNGYHARLTRQHKEG